MSGKDEIPRENFPGGDVVPEEGELRISIDKKAYAEVLAHAKEEPDVEICGVLIGKLKEDKHGTWLHLQHTIRGEGAKQQGAQVTFTHEAWNHINKVWDKEFPQLGIVGWYHTHPGFDIFLSEMDKFIHKSYFDNPNQVAYVYDPHQGTDGFFRKPKDEIVLLPRYWHGGKPRKTVSPEQRIKGTDPASGSAVGGDLAATLAALNESVRRLELEVRDRREAGGMLAFAPWLLAFAALVLLSWQLLFSSKRPELQLIGVDPKTGARVYAELLPERSPETPKEGEKAAPPKGPEKK